MIEDIEVVFLGINDAGMRIYQWLCDRNDVFVNSLLTTEDQLQNIKNIQPDYIVSCGYQHIVPEDVLSVPSEGCLNIHPSLLPFNRGANPNVWSIVEQTPAGVTIHRMDEDIDTGDILAQKEVKIEFTDNGKTLDSRLEDAQVSLFKKTWPDVVAGNITAQNQTKETGTYHCTGDFEKLCDIDHTEEVRIEDFLNRLRALTYPPYNNARVTVGGDVYYVEVDIEKD